MRHTTDRVPRVDFVAGVLAIFFGLASCTAGLTGIAQLTRCVLEVNP